MLRFLPETASADALVPRDTRGSGLKLEAAAGTSNYGFAPKKRKHLAVAVPFDRVKTDHIDRGTARTRSKLECCAFIPETASADAPVPRDTRGAGLKFEAAAGTSHHGRAPKERAVSPVRHLSTRHEPITASAAPRAR